MERNKYPLVVLSLSLLSLQPFKAAAQSAPTIDWISFADDNSATYGSSICHASDGGYVMVGTKQNSPNAYDFLVKKFSATGELIWQRTYGGSGPDEGYEIEPALDGGYLVAGRTESANGQVTGNHGLSDIWVVKIDEDGAMQWQRCYGGPGSDRLTALRRNAEGTGYLLVGEITASGGDVTMAYGGTDIWLASIAIDGTLLWERTYGGSSYDRGSAIIPTSDGGYMLVGSTQSYDGQVSFNHGYLDMWVVKLDLEGTLLWERTYGGSHEDGAGGIVELANGGYAVIGNTLSDNGDVTVALGGHDIWLVTIGPDGQLLQERSYGGSGDEGAGTIFTTPDGGYIISGGTTSPDGDVIGYHGLWDYDHWMFRVDAGGDIRWQRTMGGTGEDRTGRAVMASDGGLVITGSTNSLDGDMPGTVLRYRAWVVKFHSDEVGMHEKEAPLALRVAPNPVKDELMIMCSTASTMGTHIAIHDAIGRQVSTLLTNDLHAQRISVAHLVPGLYHVVISTADGTRTAISFVKE